MRTKAEILRSRMTVLKERRELAAKVWRQNEVMTLQRMFRQQLAKPLNIEDWKRQNL